MRVLILIASLWALVASKPEMYKEKEDFQYSRSSSDDGTKSGYYGAQRGNMGGNYERAHNMDSLAQHQMGTLVRNVDGELGEGANTRVGSVFAAANTRGLYGSGNYDLNYLKGRNFAEGTSYGDSLSQSSMSNSGYSGYEGLYSAANNARHSSSQTQSSGFRNSAASGHSSGLASQYLQTDTNTQQAANHINDASFYQLNNQEGNNYKYAQSSSQAQSEYENSNTASSDQKTRSSVAYATPVRVYIRPGYRVAIPIAGQVYDASALQGLNTVNSDTELLSTSGQRLNTKPRHYESSYSYRKEWQKQDSLPAVTVTESPIAKNSELYEDAQSQTSNKQYESELASANSQSNSGNSAYSHKYSAHSKDASSSQSYNSGASALDTYAHNAYDAGVAANMYGSQISDGTHSSNNLIENIDSKPKSYHSSYSYHKSWERRGDPYVIKPVGANEQTSQRLTAASGNPGYICNYCLDDSQQRVRRSLNTDEYQQSENLYNGHDMGQQSMGGWEQDLGQQTNSRLQNFVDFGQNIQKQTDDIESFHQQLQRQMSNLEKFGQQINNHWEQLENVDQQNQWGNLDLGQPNPQTPWNKLDDLSQQPQTQDKPDNFDHQTPSHWGKLNDLGQQTQNEWNNLGELGQQTQTQENLEDIGQQTQTQENLEDMGQQTQSHRGKLDDLGQQTQNEWNNLGEIGQQTQTQDDLEDMGQQTQSHWGKLDDLNQQTQNEWNNLGEIGQQTQTQDDLEDMGQQTQSHWGKLDELDQQAQNEWNNLGELGQQTQTQENLEDMGQQTQSHWGKLDDLGQQTQNEWNNLGELGQKTQTQDNLEDMGQQTQLHWGKLDDLGQQTQKEWNNLGELGQQTQTQDDLEDMGQQTQSHWGKLDDLGQQTQNEWNNLGELGQNTQNQNNLEDMGQQTQSQWGKLDGLGEQTQGKLENFGQQTQQTQNNWNHLNNLDQQENLGPHSQQQDVANFDQETQENINKWLNHNFDSKEISEKSDVSFNINQNNYFGASKENTTQSGDIPLPNSESNFQRKTTTVGTDVTFYNNRPVTTQKTSNNNEEKNSSYVNNHPVAQSEDELFPKNETNVQRETTTVNYGTLVDNTQKTINYDEEKNLTHVNTHPVAQSEDERLPKSETNVQRETTTVKNVNLDVNTPVTTQKNGEEKTPSPLNMHPVDIGRGDIGPEDISIETSDIDEKNDGNTPEEIESLSLTKDQRDVVVEPLELSVTDLNQKSEFHNKQLKNELSIIIESVSTSTAKSTQDTENNILNDIQNESKEIHISDDRQYTKPIEVLENYDQQNWGLHAQSSNQKNFGQQTQHSDQQNWGQQTQSFDQLGWGQQTQNFDPLDWGQQTQTFDQQDWVQQIQSFDQQNMGYHLDPFKQQNVVQDFEPLTQQSHSKHIDHHLNLFEQQNPGPFYTAQQNMGQQSLVQNSNQQHIVQLQTQNANSLQNSRSFPSNFDLQNKNQHLELLEPDYMRFPLDMEKGIESPNFEQKNVMQHQQVLPDDKNILHNSQVNSKELGLSYQNMHVLEDDEELRMGKKPDDIATPIEPTTEKPGFWRSTWNKAKTAKDKVVSWLYNI